MVDFLEMAFFLICLFIGFAIGFFSFDDRCKNMRELCKTTLSYSKYIFPFFTLLAIIIISLFSIIYYFDPSNSSFSNCIIRSIVGFFSLIDFDKYNINGIFKIAATFEYYLYSILFAIVIGILLNNAIEKDKERRWEPIKNEAYKNIHTLSNNISYNIVTLLKPRTLIVDFDGQNDEPVDEKIDKSVEDFIKKTKLDSIDNIKIDEVKVEDKIKYEIKVNEIKCEIEKSKFEKGHWENIFKSNSSELSILQIKYQQYLEPEITTNIIKIQNNLNLVENTISVYKDNIFNVKKDNLIRHIVFYLFKAAELNQELSEQIRKGKD